MAAKNTITVSAVVLSRPNGTVLTVRKAGTRMFMLPGGKPEPGETPAQTAVREIDEELGVKLDPHRLQLLNRFHTAAANEANTSLVAHVFTYPPFEDDFDVQPRAEIAERLWVSATDPEVYTSPTTAPLNADHVFPLVAAAFTNTQSTQQS